MNQDQCCYRTRSDIRFRVIAGEGVIVRQQAGEAVVVNEVGARILELLADNPSIAELIEPLAREYRTERGMLEKDVAKYLHEMEEAGVLETYRCPQGGDQP